MNKIEFGDCREIMRRWASEGIKAQTCVTSPPYYGLRDYGHDGQIGLEETPEEYIAAMVEVFQCVRNVLADDGTVWLNIGDSYARLLTKGGSGPGGKNRDWYGENYGEAGGAGVPGGCKPKDLIGIPWMLAFALRADGWYLRQDIIWHKPNPMPESVQDRCTKAHEYIFLLSRSERYYYNHTAILEDAKWERWGDQTVVKEQQGTAKWIGNKSKSELQEIGKKNRRSVWTVPTKPYEGAHFAVFPEELIEPCVMAGAPVGGVVLDPFMGSGTTAQVAQHLGRKYLGCELNPEYQKLQHKRLRQQALELA